MAACGVASAQEPAVQDPDGEGILHLVVYHKDGSEVAVPFHHKPVMTCSGTTITLTSPDMELEYAEGALSHFTIESRREQSVIRMPGASLSTAHATLGRDGILYSGGIPGAKVTVMTADGRMVSTSLLDAEGTAFIPLALEKGAILIVNSGKTSFKIIRK